uniref:Uncharacterized protein n=1 Tax=Arundo donax TaxID=35708 RepID=A0A0A9A6S7_ARUDO
MSSNICKIKTMCYYFEHFNTYFPLF